MHRTDISAVVAVWEGVSDEVGCRLALRGEQDSQGGSTVSMGRVQRCGLSHSFRVPT